MYVAQIRFKAPDPNDIDTISHGINSLLGALRMNGQIQGKELPTYMDGDDVVACVHIQDEDALAPEHHNHYVRLHRERMREQQFEGPTIAILGESVDGNVCNCSSPSSYILYTTNLTLESPLRCGDCFYPVPLYRIPATYDDEYYNIICWQSDYQACDKLQMNCGTLERTMLRAIGNPASGLSRQGREICQGIEALTGKPTYYYLLKHYGKSRAQERRSRCPECQAAWLREEAWHIFDFRCDACRLLSNIAWAVQGAEPVGRAAEEQGS